MSKKLWGGRFKKEMHPALRCFSYSLAVDKELFDAELAVNAAWAKMLARTAIITQAESKAILKGLARIEKDLEGKDIARYVAEVEDIHTLIQSELEKRSGAVAKKLHTGRSRNDLVVTSTRVCLREKIAVIRYETSRLQKALVAAAEKPGPLSPA